MAEVKSVHDFLMEWINGRFSKRIISALNTEYEREYIDKGTEPSGGEYKWIVRRMKEMYEEMIPEGEDAKETKD